VTFGCLAAASGPPRVSIEDRPSRTGAHGLDRLDLPPTSVG